MVYGIAENKTSACDNGLHPSTLNPPQEVRQHCQQRGVRGGKKSAAVTIFNNESLIGGFFSITITFPLDG